MSPHLILDGETFYYVGFIQEAIAPSHTNKRRAKCLDCHTRLEPGRGIYHKAYRNNGYVCLDCARINIRRSAERSGQTVGYGINAIGNLQILNAGPGRYTPDEVAEALEV